jgi:hypothetical protein
MNFKNMRLPKYDKPMIDYTVRYEFGDHWTIILKLGEVDVIFKKIFEMTLKKYNKKGDPNETEPEEYKLTSEIKNPQIRAYFNLAKTGLKNQFRLLAKDCRRIDNKDITVSTNMFYVDEIHYFKVDNKWNVNLTLKGEYLDV